MTDCLIRLLCGVCVNITAGSNNKLPWKRFEIKESSQRILFRNVSRNNKNKSLLSEIILSNFHGDTGLFKLVCDDRLSVHLCFFCVRLGDGGRFALITY